MGGLAAGTAALLGMANNAADTADKWDKLSERTGIGVEALQEWGYAAGQSGADIGKLAVGMKTLSGKWDDAINGSKGATESFGKLGISVDDLKTKSQEEIFNDMMYALAEMPEGAERNALGNDLLGKSYTELLPLLNSGAGGMDELRQRANDLGIVLSEDAVNAGVVFGDTMADVKDSFGAIVAKIGIEVMPIVQKLLDWVLDNMPTIQSVASTVFDVIGKVVATAGDIIQEYLIPTLESIWEWVEPYLPQIQAFFHDVFQQVSVALQGFMMVVGQVIAYVKQWFTDNQATIESIKQLFIAAFQLIQTYISMFITTVTTLWNRYGSDLMTIIQTAWDYIAHVFKTTIDIVTGVFKVFTALLKGDWSGAWDAIKETTGKAWENLKGMFSKQMELAKSILKLGLDAVKNNFYDIFTGIKNIVGGIFSGIVDSIKNSINAVISNVNWVIKKLNNIRIKIPEVDIPGIGTIGGGSIGLPQIREIPMLAEGGTITKSGAAIVGEAGAELLELPRGAKVKPLNDSANGGIVLNFYDTKVMSDRDIDILGEKLTKRLRILGV